MQRRLVVCVIDRYGTPILHMGRYGADTVVGWLTYECVTGDFRWICGEIKPSSSHNTTVVSLQNCLDLLYVVRFGGVSYRSTWEDKAGHVSAVSVVSARLNAHEISILRRANSGNTTTPSIWPMALANDFGLIY